MNCKVTKNWLHNINFINIIRTQYDVIKHIRKLIALQQFEICKQKRIPVLIEMRNPQKQLVSFVVI